MTPSLRESVKPKFLFPSLAVGLIVGIENSVLCLAFALMIFTGGLTPYLSLGITILFIGSIIHNVVTAIGSSLPGTLSGVQDGPAVILAVVIATMLAGMPQASAETKLYTALASIILTSLLTGLVCLLLGKFKMGNLVSFMPYPVVGGFLAGTGVLLALGGLQVMTGKSITLLSLGLLFQGNIWIQWVAGVLFAIILFVMIMKINHYLVLPGALAATVVVFYIVLAVSGNSVSDAAQTGWLISGMPQGEALFRFWNPAGFTQVDWGMLLRQTGSLIACVIVSLISMLLNVTALELSTDQEIDLNAELKNNGWANLISGFAGSGIGYPALGDTSLAYRLGARVRTNGIFAALVIGFVLIVGSGLLGFFPNLVLGGLVFFIGMDFLYSWLYKTWFKVTRSDYIIIVAIAVLINTLGFLQGVGIGLALAVILFVVKYSRTRAVRHTLSGVSYQSSVDRTRLYNHLLRRHGDWLYILELQGYIFFGTANQVLDEIRNHLEARSCLQPPRFVILDFRLVSGFDSSAAFSFAKIKRLVQAKGITLVLSHTSPQIRRQLKNDLPEDSFHYFSDLDHSIEWCETEMVSTFESVGLAARQRSLFQELAKSLPAKEDVGILQQYLKPREFQPGECIICQGSPQDGLFMIESGQVVIQLECEDGSALRLRTIGAGAFFGEMGLYSGEKATASIIAEQPTSLYVLMADDLAQLEKTAPPVAAALHRFVAAYMSERLAKATNTMQALMR